ncbi:unnamed protein product [Calicophoron daubneyi]
MERRLKLFRGTYKQRAWNQITPDLMQSILTYNPGFPRLLPPTASSLRLIRAIDMLRALLCGLNDKLPLNVTGVSPLSSAFRDTAVFPPVVSIPSAVQINRKRKFGSEIDKEVALSCYAPVLPLYVIVTLEQSGRWPDDLLAFRHMKRLLVIRIHELLSPLGVPSHVTRSSMLDIFLNGLVFRISIALPRELHLLETACQPDLPSNTGDEVEMNDEHDEVDKHLVPTISRTPASASWYRLNQSMPMVSGMLTSVSRGEAHVFPQACRLAKRWLSAHGYPVVLCPFEAETDGLHHLNEDPSFGSAESEQILSGASLWEDTVDCAESGGRFSEIAVELLVLYSSGFSGSGVTQSVSSSEREQESYLIGATGSPVAAFLRFLRLLATHDWEKKPLLIDLNEGFADIQKRREALETFEHERAHLPAVVLCTPVDVRGSEWTSVGPSRAGLKEIQALASQSRLLLRAMLIAGAKFKDIKTIFRPSPKRMDVLIKLKRKVLQVRAAEAVDLAPLKGYHKCISVAADKTDDFEKDLPHPGARFWPDGYCYDPLACLIRLFKIHLGRYCDILWDRHGGSWIGLKWHASMKSSKNQTTTLFSSDRLDGLVQHKQDTSQTQMCLKHRLKGAVELMPNWAVGFIHSAQLVKSGEQFVFIRTEKSKLELGKRTRVEEDIPAPAP